MIPSFELKTQYQEMKAEILEAIAQVLEKGQFILGPQVAAFEEEFKHWNGSSHGIGVGSGTEALHIAMRVFDIGPGDEVICPPFTYFATAGAVALAGATPVFADIDLDTFTLNLSQVEAKITPKTRAIVAVHLYGHPADMEGLQRLADQHKIPVIEDCAQSTGAEIGGRKVGTWGEMGCFSFFPTKNLGAYGDGGLMTAEKSELATKIQMIRVQGQAGKKYFHEIVGTNSRLDELQAAVLRIKLRRLDLWNRQRREVASAYRERITHPAVTLPSERQGCLHVYHQYTVLTENRDGLAEHLKALSIGSTVYYPLCLHLQGAFKELGHKSGDFPNSETAQARALLPMFPEMTEAQIEAVAQAVNSFQPARAKISV